MCYMMPCNKGGGTSRKMEVWGRKTPDQADSDRYIFIYSTWRPYCGGKGCLVSNELCAPLAAMQRVS